MRLLALPLVAASLLAFAPEPVLPAASGAHAASASAPLARTVAAPDTNPPVVLTRSALRFSLSRLLIPVVGIEAGDLHNSFTSPRSGGRRHNAIDINAPRGTPVVAISDGEIARMSWSRLGGRTLYLRAADGSHDFYYAHLHSYARGMEVGDLVQQGDTLGTVGTTGNARGPHLHFQILRKSGRGRGTPVNPYTLLRRSELHRESTRG